MQTVRMHSRHSENEPRTVLVNLDCYNKTTYAVPYPCRCSNTILDSFF